MIPVFLEATLRSLLVGLAVAAGMRLFRVRNVLAQKSAWGLVLVSALAMPLLLPITAQWRILPNGVGLALPAHPMTLLQELQERILAKGASPVKIAPPKLEVPQSDQPEAEEVSTPEPATAPLAAEAASSRSRDRRDTQLTAHPHGVFHGQSSAYTSVQRETAPARVRHLNLSPVALILSLYSAVAGFLLLRLVIAVFTTIRLWQTASPVPVNLLPPNAASLRLRASAKIASPITIGSAILLPTDYKTWEPEKLRIVLAHERSHIRQGDFYLQLLAGIYTALAWFSPLGWWLKHELADLAEAISDRAGIEEAASRASYAQILLEFAATPRRISLGVAMARPGSLSRRIERLLNDKSFRQCFANGRRALVAVALVPLALFASTTLVRVQAATGNQPASPVRAAAPAPAAAIAPQAQPAETEMASDSTQAEPETQPAPAFPAMSSAPALLSFPRETKAPAAEPAPLPAPVMTLAASPMPMIHAAPMVMLAPRAPQEGGSNEGGSLSFDRTLSVIGDPHLDVNTGSGNIHITRGSGSQIQIHGRINVHRDGSQDQARQIAANPPIEQNGQTIRVGQHQEHWRGISIDYTIEAPAGTFLAANSGSGDIVDEGVGQDAKLQTGSGDIRATGLQGSFNVMTGSGTITAEQTGEGDVIAQTGSGDIVLKDIHGGFKGQTGSGDIKASGTPSSGWNLQTGSGSIELQTGNAPLTLDASTGSGSVKTDHEMMVQGSFDHHHIRGKLNGGGPTVRLETGSGDIQIH